MSAIRLQLEVVGLGHLWREGDLDGIAAELERRRSFALAGSASARALLLAAALTEFWRGDFVASSGMLDEVLVDAEARSDPVASMIAVSVRGVIASFRGDVALTDAEFDRAIAFACATDSPIAVAMMHAMRVANVEVPDWDAVADDLVVCRRDLDELARPDYDATIDTAEGWALASIGRFAEAEAMLRRAVSRLDVPLERSVASVRLAEVLGLDGQRDAARDVAAETLAVVESCRAKYWMARCSIILASLEGDRGGRRVGAVLATLPDDPAYTRLFEPSGTLVIDLLDGPAVRRNGQSLVFLTRHAEAAVRLLAAAGDAGMESGELCSILWPTADPAKVGQRFRTMLWQVRSGLGSDSWRLQRRRDVVSLDLTGTEIAGRLDRPSIEAAFGGR